MKLLLQPPFIAFLIGLLLASIFIFDPMSRELARTVPGYKNAGLIALGIGASISALISAILPRLKRPSQSNIVRNSITMFCSTASFLLGLVPHAYLFVFYAVAIT